MNIILCCNQKIIEAKSYSELWMPLWTAVGIFFLNIVRQEYVRKREIKRTINNRIFKTCERLIRLAYNGNAYIVEARHCYALLKKGIDEKENKRFYYKYMDISEGVRLKYYLTLADLLSQMQDFKIHNKEVHDRVKELLVKEAEAPFNQWGGYFRETMTETQIREAYKKCNAEIDKYVEETSICTNLRKVQKIVHPDAYQNGK
jgi:hypothetical protein